VLWTAVQQGWRVTVRAAANRRTQTIAGGTGFLWPTLRKARRLGGYTMEVPARPGRRARTAHMSVRACTVTLVLKHRWTGKRRTVTLGAVWTREVRTTPSGEAPLEWMLLTTAPLATFEDVRRVIEGYAQRWKIEEFHHLWKSGRCEVETSHLHTRERLLKWATILASVAMRTPALSTCVGRDELLRQDAAV
jgi:hypothetical protein